ncbi:MAG: RDD family protein [Actinobacteria bacterium]|nr:RDD family protein [Actinomycetota bacterium]
MTDLPPPPPVYGAPQFADPTFSLELAGWWRRVGAIVLDGLIVGIPMNIVVLAVAASENAAALIAAYLLVLVGTIAYSVLMIGAKGQTLGKMATGVKVVRDGSPAPIGYGLATGRFFSTYLSAIPCYLGMLWPLWDDKNQTFHDKICSTVVIRA